MKPKRLTATIPALFLSAIPYFSASAQPPMHMEHMMGDDHMMMTPGNGSTMGYGMPHRRGMMGGQGMMGGYGMAGYPGTGSMWGALASLNLTDEQMNRIREIRSKLREDYGKLQDEMEFESLKLAKKYRADTPDPADIGKSYDKIFDAKRRMIEKRIEAHNAMLTVLDKEQKQSLDNHRGMHWMMP